jgi:putative DNA primase/helicase
MSTDLFARVREIPLEQVLREYFPSVELKRSGRDLVSARCPLHDESTPSFRVYVEQNRWHCFGACGAGGSAIDLLIRAGREPTPLDAAKALATKFSIDIRRENKRQLLVSQYADFCGLPDSFLRQTFDLRNSDSGVEIPYKDERGAVVSVQRRHKLEKGKKKDNRFSWRKGDKILPYGLWMLPPASRERLTIVEGPSDVHVLTH